MKKEKADKDC